MADRMMLETVVDEDFTNPRGAWRNEDTGEMMTDKSDFSWNELADQQRADAETAQINANRQAFDQYVAIEQGAKQQKLALDHRRAIAGAAMMQSAFRNGGMSDRSLSAAFSEAFGQPIYGGQIVKGIDMGNGPETVFAMYGATKDPRTGQARIGPVAMMGSREMLQILERAGLGDATNDMQNDILNNSYLGKLTDDQRAAMGVSRPSAPISTGTTVISGAAMRALRGQPRQRNNEGGHFAADGMGGFTKSYFNRSTGENWQMDYGTRAPDRPARWKVLESGPDGMRYENDQTGEVVRVPKGETLQNVLRGTSEKEKIARIQAQGRTDAARVSADLKRMGYDIDVAKLEESRRHNQAIEKNAADRAAGRGTGSGSGADGKYDDKYAERLKGDWQDLVEQYGNEPTPEQQKKIDAARARYDRYVDSFGGGEGAQGGEGMTPQQRAQAILAARRQNGGGATEPENTASTPAQGGGESATATAARQPEVAATSESVRDEIIGGKKPTVAAEKPTPQTQGSDKPVQSGGESSKSMQWREQNAKLKGPYASIPENVLAEFRDLYPNVSDAEINSGKHDQVLRNIAKNMGDKTTAKNLDARDEQRRRMDEDAERTERRAQNRAAVSEDEDRMASFRREMSAFEKSWDKSKRRMRAEGTYNEEFVKNYENRKRAEIRRKFGLKEDGSEDKTGSVTYRANRAIAAMDEK